MWVRAPNQQVLNRARALRRLYYRRWVSSVLITLSRNGIYGLAAERIIRQSDTYNYLRYTVQRMHDVRGYVWLAPFMQFGVGNVYFPWDYNRYRCPQL